MGNILRRKDGVVEGPRRVIWPHTSSHPQCAHHPTAEHMHALDPNRQFADNRVRTTKYSLFTFLFINLYEQFHRFANVYFLFICFLNFLPEVAAFGKEVAPVPVIVVLSITAVKDAYEDFRRYRADREVNQSLCEVYDPDAGKFHTTEWKCLRPGDIVRLFANNIIPADMLLLHSSDKSGLCHVETANLDGESNLKQREVIRGFQAEVFDPKSFKYLVDVEAPNPEIYRFSGKLLMEEDTTIPLKKENMLLRGCIVRNTESVVGMVIYAGHETKAMLNNRQAAFKRSKLERQLNKDVIWCVIVLVILCLTGAVCSGLWLNSFPPNAGLFLSDVRKESALQAFLNFWTFVIIFQAMIPLPLYVTLEFVKLGQVFYIHKDINLYDEVADRPVEVKAFNIPEDLGQIQYMFTDKTGTLTENKMEFRRCSIYGHDFTHVGPPESITDSLPTSSTVATTPSEEMLRHVPPPYYPSPHQLQQHSHDLSSSMTSIVEPQSLNSLKDTLEAMSLRPYNTGTAVLDVFSNAVRDFFFLLALCNTVVVSTNKNATVPVRPKSKPFKPKSSRWGGLSSNPNGDSSNSLLGKLTRPKISNLFPRSKKAGHSTNSMITAVEQTEVTQQQLPVAHSQTPDSVDTAVDEIDDTGPPGFAADPSNNQESTFFTLNESDLVGDLENDTAESGTRGGQLPMTDKRLQQLFLSTATPANSSFRSEEMSNTVEMSSQVREPPLATLAVEGRPKHLSVALTAQGLDMSTTSSLSAVDESSTANTSLSTGNNVNNANTNYVNTTNGLEALLKSYEAESPDEMALVKVAAMYGCKLLQRAPGFVSIFMPGENSFDVDVMHILPFDSDRKRMSVIFRHPITLEITLFCKGADASMLKILAKPNPEKNPEYFRIIQRTKQQIHLYARLGLRTLVMGMRVISAAEYNLWKVDYNEAFGMGDEASMKRLTIQIEKDLVLLGATGIEDRLQDGVPETIAALRMAGINIWVLTGDKQETAINISYTAKLISEDQHLMLLNGSRVQDVKALIQRYQDDIDRSYPAEVEIRQRHHRPPVRPDLALCIDGDTLQLALDPEVKFDFLHLAEQCASVICCRSSPKQKAEVVKLVKENLHMQTLAIGDGANDVNMIRAADVGIGIAGQEGMQAAMASDFAISRFRFLKPLLLVHGHCNYDKLSRIGLYIFYKCTVFIMVMFWYQLFNGFSGQTMIGQLYQVFFNLTFTSLPPIIVGVWDKTMNQSTLLKNPVLYTEGQNCRSYLPWHFWLNIADALWQSVVWFFVPYLVFVDSDISLWSFGDVCMTIAVVSALVHLGLETKTWTIIHVAAQLGSLVFAWFVFAMLYNALCVTCMAPDAPYWVIFNSMSDPRFWLCTVVTSIASLLPRIVIHAVKNSMWPSLTERARQLEQRMGEGKELPLEIPSQVYPVIPGTHNAVQLGRAPSSTSRRHSRSVTRAHSAPQRSQSEKGVRYRDTLAKKTPFVSIYSGNPNSPYTSREDFLQQPLPPSRTRREQSLNLTGDDPRGHKRSRSSAAAITNWAFDRNDSTSVLFPVTQNWGPKREETDFLQSWMTSGHEVAPGPAGAAAAAVSTPIPRIVVPPSSPSRIAEMHLFHTSATSNSRREQNDFHV